MIPLATSKEDAFEKIREILLENKIDVKVEKIIDMHSKIVNISSEKLSEWIKNVEKMSQKTRMEGVEILLASIIYSSMLISRLIDGINSTKDINIKLFCEKLKEMNNTIEETYVYISENYFINEIINILVQKSNQKNLI